MRSRLMTDHKLDATCGYFSPYAVVRRARFNGALLSTITGGRVPRGRCIHLNDDQEWILGVAADKVAHWNFQSSDDADISVGEKGDPATDRKPFESGVGGFALGLSAMGSYELRTTEFDDTQTYIVNQPLTAATGTTYATSGVMTNVGATYASGIVCGVVSRNRTPGSRTQDDMKQLYFWPGHYPFSTL
jgi:hypothetical protein